jgi:hypothetical protein
MNNVIQFHRKFEPSTIQPPTRIEPSTRCDHDVFAWQDLELSACPQDGSVVWHHDGEVIDGTEGMALLFGSFDLTGCLPGVGAPGDAVLVYEPSRGDSNRLQIFPAGRWIEAVPGLWFTHDNEHLLLSPTDPLVVENLTR